MNRPDRSLTFALLALSMIAAGFAALGTQEAYSTATTAIVALATIYLAQRGHAHHLDAKGQTNDDVQP